MKIEFLEAAQTELDEAFNWYEAQQLNLGIQFLNEFDNALRRSVAYPKYFIPAPNPTPSPTLVG